jgi:hypothetical protein
LSGAGEDGGVCGVVFAGEQSIQQSLGQLVALAFDGERT